MPKDNYIRKLRKATKDKEKITVTIDKCNKYMETIRKSLETQKLSNVENCHKALSAGLKLIADLLSVAKEHEEMTRKYIEATKTMIDTTQYMFAMGQHSFFLNGKNEIDANQQFVFNDE